MNTFDHHLTYCQTLPSEEAIFGQTEGMRGLWQIAEKVAGASAPILIVGEKGTGKEILARFIHSCNPGSDAPFFKLTAQLLDSHARDDLAFRLESRGIVGRKDSCGGERSDWRLCTVFVEEVSEAEPRGQLELLQWVQGSSSSVSNDGREVPAAFRVIGTSSLDLEQAVTAGKFRADLFSALSVTLRLPPLRERKEDIPQLADYFWRIYSERFGRQPAQPSAQLIDRFQRYDWPGNIRQLENVMKRYVLLGIEGTKGIGPAEEDRRSIAPVSSPQHSLSLKELTREAAQTLERKIILRTLEETRWNRRQAARVLNISYRALLYKIKAAGLVSDQRRTDFEAPDRENLNSTHGTA